MSANMSYDEFYEHLATAIKIYLTAFWLRLRLFLLLSREVVQNSLDDSIGIINIKCLDNIDDTL